MRLREIQHTCKKSSLDMNLHPEKDNLPYPLEFADFTFQQSCVHSQPTIRYEEHKGLG